jgi:hypothetical protein
MSPLPRFTRRRAFRAVVSGVAVVLLTANAPTQAQPPVSADDYLQYSAKTDAAAVSFADRFARRSAVAPVSNAGRSVATQRNVQNTPTTQNAPTFPTEPRRSAVPSKPSTARPSDAPKSQAVQTWEAFLFGTPRRPVATPKFAFGQQRASAFPARVSRPASTLDAQTARPLPNAQTLATDATPTDAEIADARRRRLQELNALLATRRPEEFSRRLAVKNGALTGVSQELNAPTSDAPALPLLVDEPSAAVPAVALQAQPEPSRDDAPFDAARANRSKIRQASNFEPAEAETLELADDGLATFLLPIRPNALRLSPNVFLSTDLVPLPSAAPLREASQSAQPVQPAQPLQSAPTPATVATPLPAASESSDVPTLRPTAQFVEPRRQPTPR